MRLDPLQLPRRGARLAPAYPAAGTAVSLGFYLWCAAAQQLRVAARMLLEDVEDLA